MNLINDYIQTEIANLPDQYKRFKEWCLMAVIDLSEDKKRKLVGIIEDLKKRGSQTPLLWAIGELNPKLKHGQGIAYFIFFKEILKKIFDLNGIYDGMYLQNKEEETLQEIKENTKDSFEIIIRELIFVVADIFLDKIDHGDKFHDSDSDFIKKWALVEIDKSGKIGDRISDLRNYIEHEDF